MGITIQEGQKQKAVRRAIDIGLAILLVIIAIVAVKLIKKDFKKIGSENKADENIAVSDVDSNSAGDEDIFVSSTVYYDGVNQGPLILVNGSTEYKWNENDLRLTENEKDKEKYKLVSLLDIQKDNGGTDCYTVLITEDKEIIEARKEAALAMNEMLKAFNKETGHTDIRIDVAYRSVAEQQELYDSELTSLKPGFSDYHTGYSFDINVINEDHEDLGFEGTGDFEWLIRNCYKYGFVIRYPKGKDDLTGQSYSPWHFRYVGTAHAAYMYENGLCLEEYIKKLTSFPYDGEHLKVSDAAGKNYEIYYFAADTTTTLTSIVVPSGGDYEISGNNSDGFIVTISLDGSAAPEKTTDAVSSDTQPTETESTEEENSDESSEDE